MRLVEAKHPVCFDPSTASGCKLLGIYLEAIRTAPAWLSRRTRWAGTLALTSKPPQPTFPFGRRGSYSLEHFPFYRTFDWQPCKPKYRSTADVTSDAMTATQATRVYLANRLRIVNTKSSKICRLGVANDALQPCMRSYFA